jgi:fatty acid-binding protein DegV
MHFKLESLEKERTQKKAVKYLHTCISIQVKFHEAQNEIQVFFL